MRFLPFALVTGLLICGCQAQKMRASATTTAPRTVEVPKDPAEKLREQLRSGAVQISAARESLESAGKAAGELRKAKGASKEIKDGMHDAADLFEDASRNLGKFADEPAPLAEFRKDLKTGEARRKAAIVACNDALHGLSDAQGIIGSLSDTTPGKLQNPLEGVDGFLDEAKDAVKGALEALGGKEEKD